MSGLLGDVLPYLYSRGNMLQRRLGGLLSDPVGTAQQAMGQAGDSMNKLSGLMDEAYANPRSYQPTNKNKLAELVGELQSGPLGFAPAGMMAGVGAKTANKALLAKAEAMEKQGAAPHAIWRETGWGRGPEGKWRFEIDDSGALFNASTKNGVKVQNDIPQGYGDFNMGPATTLLDHPELRAAYGDELVPNSFVKNNPSMLNEYRGAYDSSANAIHVYAPAKADDAASTMLHELQHAIQNREGLPGGGLPSQFKESGVDQYLRLGGEAEARLVQARQRLNAQQRAQQFPWSPEYFQQATGVPLNSLIFRK